MRTGWRWDEAEDGDVDEDDDDEDGDDDKGLPLPGVDLISACDIRFCSQDAAFQVKVGGTGGVPETPPGVPKSPGTLPGVPKSPGTPPVSPNPLGPPWCPQVSPVSPQEVDMGLAADVGTLQRLPKIVGSQRWVRGPPECPQTVPKIVGSQRRVRGYRKPPGTPRNVPKCPQIVPAW